MITRFKLSTIKQGLPKYRSALAGSLPGIPAPTATDVGTSRAFNNGAGTVAFTANAGAGATYTATSTPGNFVASGSSSPLTVQGLASNTAYTFTVFSQNGGETSPVSAVSNSITATTVPQAPTIGTATAGTASASVTFTANATGGSAITGYTVTSSPGGFTGTGASSPITVSGLANGTSYTFTVTATNANGTSAASAASNSVTPAVPTSFDSIASFTPTTATNITFSSIPQTYKHLQVRINGLTNNVSNIRVQLNGVTSGYASHYLNGTGSAANTSFSGTGTAGLGMAMNNGAGPTNPTVAIVDIIDYASTTKNKVMRGFTGRDRNDTFGEISLGSSLLVSTSAVTTVTVTCDQTWTAGSVVALYGIKG